MRRIAALLATGLGLVAAGPAHAVVPAGFEDTLVARAPAATALAFTPDGRMLVVQRFGQLRVVRNGVLVGTPALNINAKVCGDNERGLLGVAVDPDFATNRHVYLYYSFKKYGTCENRTANSPVNRVSRVTLGDNDVVNPSSEVVLVDNMPSPAGNHNAGALAFGKDGYLYVTVGDGGCDYAGGGCGPGNDAARDTHVLTGKVLRITPSGGIPADNPFRGANSARCNIAGRTTPGLWCQEIYATGLRNPFRIGFDPNSTRFFINDVGQNQWEEISLGQAGADYGWNIREGFCATGSTTNCGAPPAGLTNPIYTYGRDRGCASITGGAFVPNRVWPAAYDGSYLFADFVCQQIRRINPAWTGWVASDFGSGLGGVVDLAFGPYGSSRALYYATYKGGNDEVRRVAYTGNRAPDLVLNAAPRSGAVPLAVLFDGSQSRDPDGDVLTYEWNFGDGSPVVRTATTGHVYARAGTYTATLRVTDSRGVTVSDTVRIDAGNTPPNPRIDLPTATARFRVGDAVTLRGAASDAEDGALAASRLTWEVRLRHNTHSHPFLAPRTGNDVTFTAPPPEDLAAAATSFLQIDLKATDSKGLSRTVTQEFRPRLVNLTFASDPSGRNLVVDGTTIAAPRTLVSWENYTFRVNAPGQVDGGGQVWAWQSWSDGGQASHLITTPAAPRSYTARFARCGGGALGASVVVLGLFGVPYFRRRRRRGRR